MAPPSPYPRRPRNHFGRRLGSCTLVGMQAPTVAELLRDPDVQRALEQAWVDSLPDDPAQRHEEGGWIYMDTTTGAIAARRAAAGGRATLDLNTPPVVSGAV